MGKASKKTGKGRLDKYYKLAKYVSEPGMELNELIQFVCQRTGIPSSFGVQVDSAEQKVRFSRVFTMLHRSLRCARRLASSSKQIHAGKQCYRG
jgi:hypothetical protein